MTDMTPMTNVKIELRRKHHHLRSFKHSSSSRMGKSANTTSNYWGIITYQPFYSYTSFNLCRQFTSAEATLPTSSLLVAQPSRRNDLNMVPIKDFFKWSLPDGMEVSMMSGTPPDSEDDAIVETMDNHALKDRKKTMKNTVIVSQKLSHCWSLYTTVDGIVALHRLTSLSLHLSIVAIFVTAHFCSPS